MTKPAELSAIPWKTRMTLPPRAEKVKVEKLSFFFFEKKKKKKRKRKKERRKT